MIWLLSRCGANKSGHLMTVGHRNFLVCPDGTKMISIVTDQHVFDLLATHLGIKCHTLQL